MREKFIGTGVAVITPFSRDGSVDEKSLERIINNLIYGGIEYLVMLGTTGESVTLSKEEKQQVISIALDTIDGRVPFILGIGGNDTREIIQTIEKQDFEGIAAILSVSPYYNKPSQEGIYLHYQKVATASPLPVILYNVPGRTASNIAASTTLRLASEVENIIGIKEASGNFEQCMQIIRDRPKNFLVVSGEDALTLPLMCIGMDGVISVIANAYPRQFSEMVRACMRGQYEEARQLHYDLLEVTQLIFAEGNPAGIKALLEVKGLCENVLRLPLSPVSTALYNKLLLYKEELAG